jgi:hypothetical protein
MGHLIYTLFLAAALSAVFALADRKTFRERVYRGVYVFGGFIVAIFGVAWSMYVINP